MSLERGGSGFFWRDRPSVLDQVLQSEKSFVELLNELGNLKEALSDELLELFTNLGVLRFPVTLAQEHDLHEEEREFMGTITVLHLHHL